MLGFMSSDDGDAMTFSRSCDAWFQVYDFSSHRLALYLDSSQKLLPIIRDTIFGAMREKASVRLSNLL